MRDALDDAGFESTPIMALRAKYASAFYGPFRVAADSAPQFGDRRGYQMDPPNAREALREIEADIEEGADIVMVKPALPYLDVLSQARASASTCRSPPTTSPASTRWSRPRRQNGWIDGKRAHARDAHVDQARRRRHHHHLPRQGSRPLAAGVTA